MASHTYRLTKSDEDLLKRVMDAEGCGQTDAIRAALRAYVHKGTSGNTSETEHLRAQVEWQRRLIEQQVTLIAQAQATAARALPEPGGRRWRWPWSKRS